MSPRPVRLAGQAAVPLPSRAARRPSPVPARNAAASRAARMGLVAAADLGCSHARELACVLL